MPAHPNGRKLNQRFSLGAKHALYRADGKWYHPLKKFPGALFDANGYVLFKTRDEYERCPHLQIRQDVHAPNGIASIPGYATVTAHLDDLMTEATRATESVLEARSGFRLNAVERKAIETYAMERAVRHFERKGYRVDDVSSRRCYDLSCWKDDSELCVEVKGTTTSGTQVVLTRNEVDLQASRALFIVHSIDFAEDRPTGGVEKVLWPWSPERDRLTVINYVYNVL